MVRGGQTMAERSVRISHEGRFHDRYPRGRVWGRDVIEVSSIMNASTRMMRTVALLVFAASGAGCATMIPRDVVPERLADEAELAGMPNIRVWGDASAESLSALSGRQKKKIETLVEARRTSERSREFNISRSPAEETTAHSEPVCWLAGAMPGTGPILSS